MAEGQSRGYKVQARSTDTFGRVLCNTRNHHFIVDGPVANGCPGEAVTPAELFLAGIAACGVELVQAIGRDQQLAPRVAVEIEEPSTARTRCARTSPSSTACTCGFILPA